jgi:mono/diheme cytochrome c family protein
VGVRIIGMDPKLMRMTTSTGPEGMPRFDANSLTDDDVAAIAAYINRNGQ